MTFFRSSRYQVLPFCLYSGLPSFCLSLCYAQGHAPLVLRARGASRPMQGHFPLWRWPAVLQALLFPKRLPPMISTTRCSRRQKSVPNQVKSRFTRRSTGHKSSRVPRAANKRKRHLRKRRALYVSAGAHPALTSRVGMSVRVRRFGRGTRQPHCSLSLL